MGRIMIDAGTMRLLLVKQLKLGKEMGYCDCAGQSLGNRNTRWQGSDLEEEGLSDLGRSGGKARCTPRTATNLLRGKGHHPSCTALRS